MCDGLGALLDWKRSLTGVKLFRCEDTRGRAVPMGSSANESWEVGTASAGVALGSEGVEGCQSCEAHVGGLSEASDGVMVYSWLTCPVPDMEESKPGEYDLGKGCSAA